MRDIKGYEGLYAVTSCGKVWSYKRQKFLTIFGGEDYQSVSLSKDNKQKSYTVHRLVAEAYLPNPHNLPVVNHKDEVKYHNFINNLEWCSRSYNINYGTRNERARQKMLTFSSVGRAIDSESLNKSMWSTMDYSDNLKRGQPKLSSFLNSYYMWCTFRDSNPGPTD